MTSNLKLMAVFIVSALALTACATPAPRRMTKTEKTQRAEEVFATFDVNGDGFLTRDELRGGVRYLALGVQKTNPGLALGMQSGESASKSSQGKFSQPPSPEKVDRAVEEAFASRDADLDNRLSQDEFKKLVVERPRDNSENEFWEQVL